MTTGTVLVAAVSVVLWQNRSGTLHEGDYFAGAIGPAGSVLLWFETDGGKIAGACRFEANSERCDLTGQTSGGRQILLVVSGNAGDTNSLFTGNLEGTPPALTGWWRSAAGRTNFPVHLTHVAERHVLRARGGLHVGRFGNLREFKGSFPALPESSPFFRDVNARMTEACGQEAREFVHTEWKEIWQAIRFPSSANNWWEAVASRELSFTSERAISVLEDNYQYRGGPHGNSTMTGRNFVAENGRGVELKLADLFDAKSDWLRCLSDYCPDDLRRQKASFVVDTALPSLKISKLKEDDLAQFTLSPAGITLHFSPYHVGSYAEGNFAVHVPFEAVSRCLRSNGPATRFAGLAKH